MMGIVMDKTLVGVPLAGMAEAAGRAEDGGAARAWVSEVNSDPFLAVLLGAEHTSHLELGTAVAIAFARSPMTVAMTAYELQGFSAGRFVLGLGTQVKGHITRRFSMPWSSPAARMREYVQALQAIWTAWQDGSRLDFAGEFYTHTLMTPMFRPAPHDFGRPKVVLAGVGERMVGVAGEVGDGLFVHPFSSPEYVRQTILPSFEAGVAASGRARQQVEVVAVLLTATGQTDEAIERATLAVRRQVAFYASTPAYLPVLEAHGWGHLQPELAQLVREGRWEDLAGQVTDEVLHTFALVGDPAVVAAEMTRRWGGVLDRVSPAAPDGVDEESWAQIQGHMVMPPSTGRTVPVM
jgi:probable F420-dependent oxidoreductase